MDKFTYQTRPSADGKDQVQVDRPDSVSAIAELENGALATLMLSGVARHARDANRFEIYGTDGTIRYFAGSDTILAGKAGDAELKEVTVSPDEARSWTVEADFIEAVRAGKRTVEPSFWDGLKYMEMTEAIFQSARTGQAVALPFDTLERDDR
jgi:predicted dehydrogenase